MAVSKRLRFEILRRDNHACRYCGRTAPDVALTVDHVVAVALGGGDDPSNLVAACRDCNSGKSATPANAALVADVGADALRWARAMERAAEIAQEDRERRLEVERAVLQFWEEANHYGRPYSDWLPGDWYLSVQRWVDAGLTQDDLLEACHITIYARRKKPTYEEAWRYFCGICWRMLTERQEAALKLAQQQEEARPLEDLPRCAGDHPPVTSSVRYAAATYMALSKVCDDVGLATNGS